MIILLLSICFITLILYFSINLFIDKRDRDIDVHRELENISKQHKLDVNFNIKDKNKAAYDMVNNEIYMSNGSSIRHISEGFHEMGHAIYDAPLRNKKYNAFHMLSFFFLKYSIVVAILLYYIESELHLDVLIIPTFIFSIASIIFFMQTLKEEIYASYYGYKYIWEYFGTTRRLGNTDLGQIKLCLFNGLLSYIVIAALSVIILICQIFYTFS